MTKITDYSENGQPALSDVSFEGIEARLYAMETSDLMELALEFEESPLKFFTLQSLKQLGYSRRHYVDQLTYAFFEHVDKISFLTDFEQRLSDQKARAMTESGSPQSACQARPETDSTAKKKSAAGSSSLQLSTQQNQNLSGSRLKEAGQQLAVISDDQPMISHSKTQLASDFDRMEERKDKLVMKPKVAKDKASSSHNVHQKKVAAVVEQTQKLDLAKERQSAEGESPVSQGSQDEEERQKMIAAMQAGQDSDDSNDDDEDSCSESDLDDDEPETPKPARRKQFGAQKKPSGALSNPLEDADEEYKDQASFL